MDTYQFTAVKDGQASRVELSAYSEARAVAELRTAGYENISVALDGEASKPESEQLT